MNNLVLDASVALAICLDDEKGSIASKILDNIDDYKILVPPHWIVEVGNALLMAFRRGRIKYEEISIAISMLTDLEMKTVSLPSDIVGGEVVELAKIHKLTVYDAYYLYLAIAHEAIIATLDNALAKAAKKENLKVF